MEPGGSQRFSSTEPFQLLLSILRWDSQNSAGLLPRKEVSGVGRQACGSRILGLSWRSMSGCKGFACFVVGLSPARSTALAVT